MVGRGHGLLLYWVKLGLVLVRVVATAVARSRLPLHRHSSRGHDGRGGVESDGDRAGRGGRRLGRIAEAWRRGGWCDFGARWRGSRFVLHLELCAPKERPSIHRGRLGGKHGTGSNTTRTENAQGASVLTTSDTTAFTQQEAPLGCRSLPKRRASVSHNWGSSALRPLGLLRVFVPPSRRRGYDPSLS